MEMDSKQRESRSLSAPGLFDYIGTFSDTNSTIAQPFKHVVCEIPSTTKLFELKVLGSVKDGLNFVKLVDVELCFDIDNFKVTIMRELGLCVIAHSYATGTGAYNVNILLAPEDVDLNHTINIDFFSNVEPSQLSITSYATSPTVSGTSFTRIHPLTKLSDDSYNISTNVDRWSVLKIPESVTTIVVNDYADYVYLIRRIVRQNGEAFADGAELTLINSANNVGGKGLAFLNNPAQETGVGAILSLPEAKWWIGDGDFTGKLSDNVTKYRTLIPNVIVKLISSGGKWIPQLIPSPNACIGEVDSCGFREGTEWSDFNFYRLQALLANKVKVIDLKGKTICMRLSSNLNLDYALHLCNGTINVTADKVEGVDEQYEGYKLTVSNGFAIEMKDLTINDLNANWNMFMADSIDFSIDYIHITNCNLINIRTLINLQYYDFVPTGNFPKVHSLRIINSKIEWNGFNPKHYNGIKIHDAVFGSVKIINNSFTNYNVAINISRSNEFNNAALASSYSGKTDITGNHFDGGVWIVDNVDQLTTYHCAVLSEQHETIFRNNMIVRCITVNNSSSIQTATYDCYLSDDIVTFANNIVNDILSLGSYTNVFCELFKSKAYNNLDTIHTRSFINNVVEINPETYAIYCDANNPPHITMHSTNVGFYMDSMMVEGNRVYAPKVQLRSSYFYAVNFVCRNNSYRFTGVNDNTPRNLFQFHPLEGNVPYPDIENIDIENNIIEFINVPVGILKLSAQVNNDVKIINNTFINCIGNVLSRVGDAYINTAVIGREMNISNNKYIDVATANTGGDLRVAPAKYHYERFVPSTGFSSTFPLYIYPATTNLHVKMICENTYSVNSTIVLARINFYDVVQKIERPEYTPTPTTIYYKAKLTVAPDGNPTSVVLYLKYDTGTIAWSTSYDGTYTLGDKMLEVEDYKAYIRLISGQLRLHCAATLSYMVKPYPMTLELETIPDPTQL